MEKRNENIAIPALGCKVGQAYQIMLRQLADALREAGLDITTGEYLVLRAVNSREGLQQCEIADMIGKDKAAVCRCVSGLMQKGMVKTEVVSHKCLKVYLTDESRHVMPAVLAVSAKRHKALMNLTSPEELDIFTTVIEKIINSK